MKVRELIELLQQCDPEHTVVAPLDTTDWVERHRMLVTVRVVQCRTEDGFERDFPTGHVVVLDERHTQDCVVYPKVTP